MAIGRSIKIIHLIVYLNGTFKSNEGKERVQGRQYSFFAVSIHKK
jgi:hypothetical protein